MNIALQIASEFHLDPPKEDHAGAARLAHNWALARVTAVMDQRAAEHSYGVPDDLLTPVLSWLLPALRRVWNAVNGPVAVKRQPPHRESGSDRERPTARRDYQPRAHQSALKR